MGRMRIADPVLVLPPVTLRHVIDRLRVPVVGRYGVSICLIFSVGLQ